jgi:hypothetical protein
MYEYSGANYAIDLSPVRNIRCAGQDGARKIVYNSRSILPAVRPALISQGANQWPM